MPDSSPFHAGEQAVQSRLGVRDTIEPWARQVVRPFLPEQHREFYSQLPFLVAAARDAEGRPWATLLTGAAGFVQSPSPGGLRIATRAVPGDALEDGLAPGADIGLLGIDLATRRRNRVNGRIASHRGGALDVELLVRRALCPRVRRAVAGLVCRRDELVFRAFGAEQTQIDPEDRDAEAAARRASAVVDLGLDGSRTRVRARRPSAASLAVADRRDGERHEQSLNESTMHKSLSLVLMSNVDESG